jgi:hypothetical protein
MSLPRIKLGDLEVPRLMMGGNPLSGFSHGSPERTRQMLDYFTTENAKKLLRRCEESGVSAVVLRADNHVVRLLHEYWNDGGKLDWVAQTQSGMDPIRSIRHAAQFGAKAIYLHGGTIEEYFERGEKDQVRRQLEAIKEVGLPAGVASHYPPYLLEIEEQHWPTDFYMVCMYHIEGYRGKLGLDQHEKFIPEHRAHALKAIRDLPKPCLAYKILAAGRLDPRAAYKEVFEGIKPTDGVVVGMFPPDAKNGDIVAENAALVQEFGGGA